MWVYLSIECAHFWITWEVLKPSQEQTDSLHIWAMSVALCIAQASEDSPLCLWRSFNFKRLLSKCSDSGNTLGREELKKGALKEPFTETLLVWTGTDPLQQPPYWEWQWCFSFVSFCTFTQVVTAQQNGMGAVLASRSISFYQVISPFL